MRAVLFCYSVFIFLLLSLSFVAVYEAVDARPVMVMGATTSVENAVFFDVSCRSAFFYNCSTVAFWCLFC